MNTAWVIGIIIALVAGAAIGYFLRQFLLERQVRGRQAEADRMIEEAEGKAREIELKARDQALL